MSHNLRIDGDNNEYIELNTGLDIFTRTQWRLEIPFAAIAPISRWGRFKIMGLTSGEPVVLELRPSGGNSIWVGVNYGFNGNSFRLSLDCREELLDTTMRTITIARDGDTHTATVTALSETGTLEHAGVGAANVTVLGRDRNNYTEPMQLGAIQGFDAPVGGNRLFNLDPGLSNGTGLVLKDSENSNNGALKNYSNDDSQWISDGSEPTDIPLSFEALQVTANVEGLNLITRTNLTFDPLTAQTLVETFSLYVDSLLNFNALGVSSSVGTGSILTKSLLNFNSLHTPILIDPLKLVNKTLLSFTPLVPSVNIDSFLLEFENELLFRGVSAPTSISSAEVQVKTLLSFNSLHAMAQVASGILVSRSSLTFSALHSASLIENFNISTGTVLSFDELRVFPELAPVVLKTQTSLGFEDISASAKVFQIQQLWDLQLSFSGLVVAARVGSWVSSQLHLRDLSFESLSMVASEEFLTITTIEDIVSGDLQILAPEDESLTIQRY